ncbi:helix-turn-helix domain-containing protein [Chitinophaga qingshengii]|uniref:Helix-turn-helix transcriptional regulator n=1 Tax=Chitinophaga qingshengii TaxID=1569794 RepID=A0ABR7TXN3_9BACT|nr:AraC family transcriptional regulator [Chitinophaga qingshengii]MBC9934480.1 helix-turn-helix transcriptional regulator [Chitinophaga qingshengii]
MKHTVPSPVVYPDIASFHEELGLPAPQHPLISYVSYEGMQFQRHAISSRIMLNFYKISFIHKTNGMVRYGQHYYDFKEGGLCFMAPGQLISGASPERSLSGVIIFFHPDLIRHHPLGQKIRQYGFFSYAVSEALHLTEKEKDIILKQFEQIGQELDTPADRFSQDLLVSGLELLLDYSNRFYHRQFTTYQEDHSLLSRLDTILLRYFDSDAPAQAGLPGVQYVSEQMHCSPDYLSDLLRVNTGLNTQQHIHRKLLEIAKDLLGAGEWSVADIAYKLGFEQPQSFNRLFKNKTGMSPLAYRRGLRERGN